MWACRSFLRRPNPLSIPRTLRPAIHRQDANQRTTVHGKNHLTASPRRHVSDAANRDPHHPAAATTTTRRHLYVVLDDHKHEYGIYKLDVGGDLDGDHDVGSDPDSARRLPDPAVIRVEVPTAIEDLAARFAALGSCIITTGSSPNTYGLREEHYGVTLVYDTDTAALSVACNVPKGLRDGFREAVAAGGRLYAFEDVTELHDERGWEIEPLRPCPGGMHCMTTDRGRDADESRWCWLPFSGSSRCFWSADPESPPFFPEAMVAHAEAGRAIFVSASAFHNDVRTFSYDTARDDWTRCGGWALPFVGRAGYDAELDAWVGLHRKGYDTDGHLCVCRVPVPTSDLDRTPQPQWKIGGEKVILEHPDWRHVDAKLVHMAERGQHCLVERLRREGTDEKESLPDGDECLLVVTTFQVKYGDDGELVTSADRRYARTYKVSRYRDDFEVAAFWI
ncbi:hypothetical protein CFC21_068425 [Triticum aestivum]|uniref:Uncharacterized protein n=3 Tax=Triticum TaxID=4564 RepID=A0A9R1H9F0_WHEAT|nr:hypothetical protein CFC21_068425 [Triticum aestivum]